jgi:hypothetical protein
MSKLKNPAAVNVPVSELHMHELMDRCSSLVLIFDTLVVNHPAAMNYEFEINICLDAMSHLYQVVGADRFPRDEKLVAEKQQLDSETKQLKKNMHSKAQSAYWDSVSKNPNLTLNPQVKKKRKND